VYARAHLRVIIKNIKIMAIDGRRRRRRLNCADRSGDHSYDVFDINLYINNGANKRPASSFVPSLYQRDALE
jgi:hypothetical protein